jgi:hypothetical protein
MSKGDLTGYSNMRLCVDTGDDMIVCGRAVDELPPGFTIESEPVSEVYLYDAESNRLACASCMASGTSPLGESYLPPSDNATYQPIYISEGGSVFFDSAESLVPQDTNGATDVYEYSEGGGLHLISNGAAPGPSFFDAADLGGGDVFFTTKQQLVSGDGDEQADLYDARVDGGFPAPAPMPGCGDETACRGPVNESSPAFGALASGAFVGPGNVIPTMESTQPPKPTSPKSKQCKKGFLKKRGRCVKRKAKKSSLRDKKGGK